MKALQSTRKLTIMGVMAAISIILIYVIRFPIIPAASFLEYEPGDIPLYMIAFLFGPASGLIVTIVVSILQGITVSAGSGIIGIIMHIFATGAFVLVAGNLYRLKKDRKQVILALIAGSVVMVISMCIWNIIFTPIFMGVSRDTVIAMLIPAIIPFNLIKAGINSIATLLLYETVVSIVKSR
jgi:riboflavin transporter FmnP